MAFTKRDQLVGPVYRSLAKHDANVDWLDPPDHIQVNGGAYCYIKYADRNRAPQQYSFDRDELLLLWGDVGKEIAQYGKAFLALVYGTECVCLLKADEYRFLLEPEKADRKKQIYVKKPPSCQMRVRSSIGNELNHKVPQNRFPDLLLNQPSPVPPVY